MISNTNKFEQLPEEKQSRIVNASISEFAEKDYETASMNTVVNQAGISKGSLFNYFKTKSVLYDHIYQLALGEVKSYLRDVRDETIDLSFENRLSKIVDSGVRFITEHPRLARIYFRLVYSGDSPNREKIVNELQECHKQLTVSEQTLTSAQEVVTSIEGKQTEIATAKQN